MCRKGLGSRDISHDLKKEENALWMDRNGCGWGHPGRAEGGPAPVPAWGHSSKRGWAEVSQDVGARLDDPSGNEPQEAL